LKGLKHPNIPDVNTANLRYWHLNDIVVKPMPLGLRYLVLLRSYSLFVVALCACNVLHP